MAIPLSFDSYGADGRLVDAEQALTNSADDLRAALSSLVASATGLAHGDPVRSRASGRSHIPAAAARRTGGGDARQPGEAAVENFAGARIDLSYDDAIDQARRFAPNLLVCEAFDFVGPLVAAALDLPWAAHAITAPIPEELSAAMHAGADAQHAARDLRPRQRSALVDPLPEVLRSPTDPPLPTGRPRVLVTAGTSVHEPDLLTGPAVRGVLTQP